MQEQASFIAGALTALNEPVPDAGFSICIMSGRNLLKQYKELFEDEKKKIKSTPLEETGLRQDLQVLNLIEMF